jgi:hypothetical protein
MSSQFWNPWLAVRTPTTGLPDATYFLTRSRSAPSTFSRRVKKTATSALSSAASPGRVVSFSAFAATVTHSTG